MLRISKKSWHYRYGHFFWISVALFCDKLLLMETDNKARYEKGFDNFIKYIENFLDVVFSEISKNLSRHTHRILEDFKQLNSEKDVLMEKKN